MKAHILYLLCITLIGLLFNSCKKGNCQTCTRIMGGVAGNINVEERKVCDEDEAQKLEKSSSGTTTWECK